MEGTRPFSFGESCVRAWEGHRELRKRAIKGNPLLVGEKENSDDEEDLGMHIPQSLGNIRLNYTLLKAYTKHMARSGCVVTRNVVLLKEPLTKFYELMEIDMKHPAAKAVCAGQAVVIKKCWEWSSESGQDGKCHGHHACIEYMFYLHWAPHEMVMNSLKYAILELHHCWL